MRPAIRPRVRSYVRVDHLNRPIAGSGWDRRRLLAILAGGVLTAPVLVAGLGLAVYYALGSFGGSVPAAASQAATAGGGGAQKLDAAGPAVPAGFGRGRAYRDSVASAPMLTVNPDSARRGVPSALPAPTVLVPAATRTGPAGVPTGFPQTPAGAVAQLAAIESTVLEGMSIPQVNDVHHRWTLTGAVGVADWPLTHNVQAFLAAAGQGQSKDLAVTVTVTPVAGMVKGVDGDDWVLACVLMDVRAVITTDARIGYGHCERLQWTALSEASGAGGVGGPGGREGRWMIAPGPSPAPAPSTWPGTDLAIRAGWRTWVDTTPGPGIASNTGVAADAAPGAVRAPWSVIARAGS